MLPLELPPRIVRSSGSVIAALASVLMCLALAPARAGVPSDGTWASIGPPAVRHSASIIYDPGLDGIILFGGASRRGDCWTLTVGASPTWTEIHTTGARPTPRDGHTSVYDPVRDRMIVFGGDDGEGVDYENTVNALPLDGSEAWSQLTTTGTAPLGRTDHTMVYDSIRDRVVVFGGVADFQRFEDVRALSLSGTPAWSEVLPPGSGPSARYGHVAIFDPVGDRMIVFGGSDLLTRNDVWALNFSGVPAWTQLTTLGASPPLTTEAVAVYDPTPGRMIVFGGDDGESNLSNDAWSLSLDSLRWTKLEPAGTRPTSRFRHAATYDPTRDRMLVFGGTDPNRENDVWALSLTDTPAWTELPDLGTPWDRGMHSGVYDPLNQRMVLFGGTDGTVRNSTRILPLTGTPRWSTLSVLRDSLPAPRVRYSAIHDPVRERMIIFGGWDELPGSNFKDDTWALSLFGTPTWTPIDPPGQRPATRMEHAAIYDSRRDRMIVIGGYLDRHDVWALPLSGTPVWTPPWTPLNPTGAFPYERGIAAVYDPVGDRAIVFNAIPNDWDGPLNTWELTLGDNPQWNPLPTSGLSHRGSWGMSAIYDPIRHRVVLMDGDYSSGRPAATTELSLSTLAWRAFDLVAPRPVRRAMHAAIYDSHRDRMLITGQFSAVPNSESNTWSLTWGDPVKPSVDCATPSGEQQDTLSLPYVLAHPLSGTRAVAWTLSADRAWPGFPLRGIENVEGGTPETLTVSVPLPDTAAAGKVQLHMSVELSGATGNANVCDHEVTFAVTPTLAAVVTAEANDHGIRLRWHVSGEGSVVAQRRTLTTPWTAFRNIVPDGEGYAVVEDLDVEAGAQYGYRLTWNSGGREVVAGEVWVEMPVLSQLALAGLTPNPSTGPVAVAFSIPSAGTARIDVLDIAGRSVGVGRRLDLAAGNHVVAFGERRLAPGVYLVRLEFGGRTLHRRAVILR